MTFRIPAMRRARAALFPLCAGMALLSLPLIARAVPVTTTNSLVSGTPFTTEAYIHDSGNPGPTIFICGGAHGNEPAGAAAAETIRHWPITKGKLVVVPRANVLSLAANKRLIPNL